MIGYEGDQWRFKLKCLTLGLLLGMGVWEGIVQWRESTAIGFLASRVVAEAKAVDRRETVLALRDYVRRHVTFVGAPHDDRKFFRDSAVETLQSGKGYCGEATRVFIVMARAVGIEAQRLNLWGRLPHVVAQVILDGEGLHLVDVQSPPQIEELALLDQVMAEGRYQNYYTLNLRRVGLSGMASRLNLNMQYLTYWTENPHALSSLLWCAAAMGLLLYEAARRMVRAFLHYRGWVHAENSERLQAALQAQGYRVEPPASPNDCI